MSTYTVIMMSEGLRTVHTAWIELGCEFDAGNRTFAPALTRKGTAVFRCGKITEQLVYTHEDMTHRQG